MSVSTRLRAPEEVFADKVKEDYVRNRIQAALDLVTGVQDEIKAATEQQNPFSGRPAFDSLRSSALDSAGRHLQNFMKGDDHAE